MNTKVTRSNMRNLTAGTMVDLQDSEPIILISDYEEIHGGYHYHDTEMTEDGDYIELESGHIILAEELLGCYFYVSTTDEPDTNIQEEQKQETLSQQLSNLKSYKSYNKEFIGSSDIASLVMVGIQPDLGAVPKMLDFGEDGEYCAYVVDEQAQIGEHYKLVATYNYWLKIYDDYKCTFHVYGDTINVYQAGTFGCIIQVIGKADC